MDPSDKPSQDLLGLIRSWVPWKSESANVSRDFWMPDQSCLVCYDCDSQFTLFYRRHHCRLCGRVFCSKCTSNWVPSSSSSSDPRRNWEEQERIRACNYCFKQWEQGLNSANVNNGTQCISIDPPTSISSPSRSSFISAKSSGTIDSSIVTVPSAPPVLSPRQGSTMEASRDRQQSVVAVNRGKDPAPEMEYIDESPDRFEYCMSRLFDDDDDFGVNDYYNHLHFEEMENNYTSHNIHPDEKTLDTKSLSNSSLNFQPSEEIQNVPKNEDNECEEEAAPSCIQVPEEQEENEEASEPVDFENNGVLWLPPEPEDEEDERESLLLDDDDEGDATGEWSYSRASSSSGSEEYRSKTNTNSSNEEHKTEVKNVVDGHFRVLVAQLLQVENLPVGEEGDSASWLEIITSLSWEAATLLKPDTSKGGGMDPGGYVKVKCLASGQRSDSMVVKGIVCKKNVAHRRMTSKIEKPRILILGGALEYQRVSNLLSSFDTLLQQEMDHLKMAVAKIDSHHPDVLLVEKSVSRYAQEYLLAKDISLVLNIKRPLLERIARCTGGQIVPSIDHMSAQKLGYCDKFHVEKFLEEHGTAGQGGKKLVKTLMYFEGCPKPLGCTVLLRGANGDDLKKLKHVVQYGVFAAYHLALETSFLADEGATLPENPLNAPITVALPDKPLFIDRSISTIPGFTLPSNGTTPRSNNVSGSNLTKDFNDPVIEYPTLTTPNQDDDSASDKVIVIDSCTGPITLNQNVTESEENDNNGVSKIGERNENFTDMSIMQLDGRQICEEQTSSLREEFPPSPSDHQRILVSLSSRCVWKGTVCERSHLFRIKYYGTSDKPLGRYLRDHLFDQSYRCASCEMPSEAHVQCYTHQQGSLTISVKKLPEFLLPGEIEGKIWMWHRCLKCSRINGFPPATRRVVMSDAAWGLSFGKFLELSFSNHAAATRVATCGHSLHRDCVRFYGYGSMVACFRYASIAVHSVFLPPPKLEFNYKSQDWIQRELKEVIERAELLFSEVLNAVYLLAEKRLSGASQVSTDKKIPQSRRQVADLESILHKEKEEFEESIKKIMSEEVKKGQPVLDILEINRLRRQLLFQSYMWDHRLIYAANLDNKIEIDEVDISVSEPVPETLDDLKKDLDNVLAKEKTSENHDRGVVDVSVDSDQGGTHSSESDSVIASLSDTLDAAWTGEIQSVSETVTVPETLVIEKLDLEDDLTGVKPSQNISSKGLENMEENVSWLGMPFVSFYRSLNKSFLGYTQKLDTFNDYNPVYISSFRESELQGGARLLLPVGVNDTVIPVYDDEPTSVISYALVSPDYLSQLSSEHEKVTENQNLSQSLDLGNSQSFNLGDDSTLESFKSLGSASVNESFSRVLDQKTLHARVSFGDDGSLGKVTYTVTCYYAKQFDALRKICCPSEMDFVRSLSRCKKWGAQGGKSNVFFAKSLDDRFIIKQVTKTELESFIKFAPDYFKYLSESIETRSPTCLARILGIYQVISKHVKGGKETKMDLLVMENLLFERTLKRLYDLKGSTRSRYNADSSGSNKVLLDQNLIEAMPTSPIFVGNKAKRLLERAVWNDTAFLASIDVMDYSLLVGVDEEKDQLVLGIIDFMRQYTWDKHLETWVKSSGILGGPRNASPTVISPKQYKKRFRKAMTTYFLMVPDQWAPPTIVPSTTTTQTETELPSEEQP